MDLSFYCGKTVLVTGHTGFKGSWMCKLLAMQGAHVVGYALEPPTSPNLYTLGQIGESIEPVHGDVRDMACLEAVLKRVQPEIVIHMAAQPIVRESYANPVFTYATNVMGTIHILEAARRTGCVRSLINVTTDKVYQNNEWEWGYRENDRLDGYDPYSNSKSCSELATAAYRRSFFGRTGTAVSTCRAGNVIGGGDFARDRVIPDCVRAIQRGEPISIRNPRSTRPYQHVLEPVCAYLLLAQKQYEDRGSFEGVYNIGPDDCDCVTTGELATLFCRIWGEGASWANLEESGAPHEAGFLKLDCSRIKRVIGWKPRWHIADALEKTVEWSKAYLTGQSCGAVMERQIQAYLEEN